MSIVIFFNQATGPWKVDATSHRKDVKPGSQPIKRPNRRMPVQYKDDLKEKLDAFMTKELITPCHSPYFSTKKEWKTTISNRL